MEFQGFVSLRWYCICSLWFVVLCVNWWLRTKALPFSVTILNAVRLTYFPRTQGGVKGKLDWMISTFDSRKFARNTCRVSHAHTHTHTHHTHHTTHHTHTTQHTTHTHTHTHTHATHTHTTHTHTHTTHHTHTPHCSLLCSPLQCTFSVKLFAVFTLHCIWSASVKHVSSSVKLRLFTAHCNLWRCWSLAETDYGLFEGRIFQLVEI